MLTTLFSNTEIGQKVKDITAKGNMVPPEITVDLLLKNIHANTGKYQVSTYIQIVVFKF